MCGGPHPESSAELRVEVKYQMNSRRITPSSRSRKTGIQGSSKQLL